MIQTTEEDFGDVSNFPPPGLYWQIEENTVRGYGHIENGDMLVIDYVYLVMPTN